MNKDLIGIILIFLGILAWIAYFALLILGFKQPVFPFLIWHLTCIIPGALLKERKLIARILKR